MTDPAVYQPPKVRVVATYHVNSADPRPATENVEVELNDDSIDPDFVLSLVAALLVGSGRPDDLRLQMNPNTYSTGNDSTVYLRRMEARS